MEGFALFDRVHDEAAGGLIPNPNAADNGENEVYRISGWDKQLRPSDPGQFCLSQCWKL